MMTRPVVCGCSADDANAELLNQLDDKRFRRGRQTNFRRCSPLPSHSHRGGRRGNAITGQIRLATIFGSELASRSRGTSNLDRAHAGEHGVGARAIARVASSAASCVMLVVAEGTSMISALQLGDASRGVDDSPPFDYRQKVVTAIARTFSTEGSCS